MLRLKEKLNLKKSISRKWDSNSTEEAHKIIKENEKELRESMNKGLYLEYNLKFSSEAIVTWFFGQKKIKTTVKYQAFY